jgi:membrane-bound lytic murein transglycosylase A
LRTWLRVLVAAGLVALAACDQSEEAVTPVPDAALRYVPVAVKALPGWSADQLSEALPAWRNSCRKIINLPSAKLLGPGTGTASDWQGLCEQLGGLPEGNTEALRHFIEINFSALQVTSKKGEAGLFTGYFEPILDAARGKSETYSEPIYALPKDHVTVRLGNFDPTLKGKSLVGRVENGQLVPYRERGEIDQGVIVQDAEVLYWARDLLDVFILQVQGSGIVEMPDGARQRIGFAGHNGHAYESLGRWLIAEGELEPNRAAWEDIRNWLETNPAKARSALAVNPRFIFFRELDGDGPLGAAGVPLVPERSMAVDPEHMPLNVPVWVDIEHPDGNQRLQRLMLAQDVGSAIKGVVRGDFYWGTGRAALDKAGRMKSAGSYYILVPKTLIPVR